MTRSAPPDRPETPTVERLKRRREFLKVARQGRKWVMPGLVLQARRRRSGEPVPDGGEDAVRIGFTVSKKVGNAVVRNRVRRRLKAAATAVAEEISGGQDLVVIGRVASLKRSYPDLLDDMRRAVRKLNGSGRPADGIAKPRGTDA